METTDPGSAHSNLTWENVALASSFIAFDVLASKVLRLDIGASLATSAVRCVVQLALVAVVPQAVFEAENGWAIAGIVCECSCLQWMPANTSILGGLLVWFYSTVSVLLNFLGTVEAGVPFSARSLDRDIALKCLGYYSNQQVKAEV